MNKSAMHAIGAKSEGLGMHDALSAEELDAVSGGEVSVTVFGHKVTASDVASAAKWVWHKLF